MRWVFGLTALWSVGMCLAVALCPCGASERRSGANGRTVEGRLAVEESQSRA